jgi:hypothetical protein
MTDMLHNKRRKSKGEKLRDSIRLFDFTARNDARKMGRPRTTFPTQAITATANS